MRLCECNIENFGTLENFSCKFPSGLCTLVRENGAGKTTLSVFIKAMLYGLEDTRRARLSENDRRHYLPWNGKACRGSLTIEVGEKKYRIERSFGQKGADDTFALYDLKSGRLCEDYSEKIGEELFGIDADGFERTLFLSEANLSGKNENKSIAAKLSDLSDAKADIGVLDDAISLLDDERKYYYKKGGSGEIANIREKISDYTGKVNAIERKKEEYAELITRERELNSKLSALRAEKKQADRENERLNQREIMRGYEKTYLEKLEYLKEEKKKQEALGEFFKKHIPTGREIENMIVMSAEYDKISLLLKNSIGYTEKGRSLDLVKINELKNNAKSIERDALIVKEKRLSAVAQRERASAIFKGGAPDMSTVEEHIKSAGEVRKRPKWMLLISLLLLLLGAGLGFIEPYYALFALLSLPLLFAYLTKKPASAAAEDDFVKRYIKHFDNKQSYLHELYEIKTNIEFYNTLMNSADALQADADTLDERIRERSLEIDKFLADYQTSFDKGYFERLSELEIENARMQSAIGIYEKEYFDNKKKYESLKSQIGEFTSLFPVSSEENAIYEIKAKLAEYERLCENIRRATEDIDYFATINGIDKSRVNSEAFDGEIIIKIDTGAIFEQISALEAEHSRLKVTLDALEFEIDRQEEYEAEISLLKAKEKSALGMYNTIERTKEFLKLASNNISEKYLAKTRSAFLEYMELFAKESAGMEIDTTFAVKKNEGAFTKDSEAYSRGTRDLHAIAVRFALVDALYEKESPFIVLDDPFAYFDDEKLSRALSLLRAMGKKRQIIYLSCTKARSI